MRASNLMSYANYIGKDKEVSCKVLLVKETRIFQTNLLYFDVIIRIIYRIEVGKIKKKRSRNRNV